MHDPLIKGSCITGGRDEPMNALPLQQGECIHWANGEQRSRFKGSMDESIEPLNLLGKLYRINRRIYIDGSTHYMTPDHASE